MAAKMQRGLGRGLGALLGEAAETSEAARDEVRSLKLTDIDPNRGQPRERFEETALRELAESHPRRGRFAAHHRAQNGRAL